MMKDDTIMRNPTNELIRMNCPSLERELMHNLERCERVMKSGDGR